MNTIAPVIERCFIYPVKSLRGISSRNVRVVDGRIAMDREFMILDEQGKMLSLREKPELARFEVSIAESGGYQVIDTFDTDTATNHVTFTPETLPSVVQVNVHGRILTAHHTHGRFNSWLSTAMKVGRYQLVKVLATDVSRCPKKIGESEVTMKLAFQDSSPVSIVSRASLDNLCFKMSMAHGAGVMLDEARFRPNLIVSNCDAYAEETWRKIKINGVTFIARKKIPRCKVIDIDPKSGLTAKPSALAELAKYKAQKSDDGKNEVTFGMYFVPVGIETDSNGLMGRGDEVTVLE